MKRNLQCNQKTNTELTEPVVEWIKKQIPTEFELARSGINFRILIALLLGWNEKAVDES